MSQIKREEIDIIVHRFQWRTFVVIVVFGGLSGCMSFSTNPSRFEKQIRQCIPIGTSLVEASAIMEKQGFECRNVSNGRFVNGSGSTVMDKTYENITFLYCHKGEQRFMGPVVWTVALVHDNKLNVTNILVCVRTFGLGDL